jgi:hypothetical protein
MLILPTSPKINKNKIEKPHMIEYIIDFLKDGSNVSDTLIYCPLSLIGITLLKYLFRPFKIILLLLKCIFILIAAYFVFVVLGNAIITEKYIVCWMFVITFTIISLKSLFPKLVNWFDHKIDDLADRIREL